MVEVTVVQVIDLAAAARQPLACAALHALYGAPELPSELFGLRFPNPVGLAAGASGDGAGVHRLRPVCAAGPIRSPVTKVPAPPDQTTALRLPETRRSGRAILPPLPILPRSPGAILKSPRRKAC